VRYCATPCILPQKGYQWWNEDAETKYPPPSTLEIHLDLCPTYNGFLFPFLSFFLPISGRSCRAGTCTMMEGWGVFLILSARHKNAGGKFRDRIPFFFFFFPFSSFFSTIPTVFECMRLRLLQVYSCLAVAANY